MHDLLPRHASLAFLGAALATPLANAAVTEPNGDSVPQLTQPGNYSETTLADYFFGAGEFESLEVAEEQVVALAAAEPGQFSPLCNFEATLVLSQGGVAGIAWYNVPADPTAPIPAAELHHILAPSNQVTGTINATDIRADPAYAGGYIAFALTKDFDNEPLTPPTVVYYSEYQRNALCTDCSPPGNWVAALAFRSNLRSDTYYLAFEDWEGASASANSWSNDGDFNDKVFKIVGISCAGGGTECETGQLGLCGKGLTECTFDGGEPICKPQYTPRAEECDAIDNDCNGEVDEGPVCPTGYVCVHGSCVVACSIGEFDCPSPLECGDDGYCIDRPCVDVICGEGLACRGGQCVNACSGIVCPLAQTCVDGACKDLCNGVVCAQGSVCKDGVCIGTCGCTPCTADEVCDIVSGYCVDPGCEGVSCGVGMGCVAGACVDACAVASCPGGAPCVAGDCEPPPVSSGGTGGASTGTGGGIVINGAGGTPGAGAASPSAGGGGATGAPGASKAGDSGCGCAVPASRSRGVAWALLALACFGLRRRGRQELSGLGASTPTGGSARRQLYQ